ncbi:MAG: hypothetical protein RLZZ383_604 [Pseudomonadota bacterium]|jgi:dienelactone hydrolase
MLLWSLHAALALTPGPHAVGYRDVVFQDAAAGTVYARVHYPAVTPGERAAPDTAAGPYPLAAMLHGYLGSAWMYQGAADHIASLGFVVVNMDTETGLVLDIERYAEDTRAALDWVQDREPGNWLEGLTDGGAIVAMGHSMGGATLSRLIQLEPRIDTLIGFMPYLSEEPSDYLAFSGFEGDALYLAGTSDETATTDIVRDWYRAMNATGRGLWMTLTDVGHQAVSDIDFDDSPKSDEEERDIVLQLAEDFLRAKRLGEPEAWRRVLDAAPPETAQASSSSAPIVLAVPRTDGEVYLTVAARGQGSVQVWAGRGPGQTVLEGTLVDLRDAEAIGRLTLTDGIGRDTVSLPDGLSGLGWVQLFDEVGAISPPIDVFGVGDPGPVAPPDDTAAPGVGGEVPTDAQPDGPIAAGGACAGCAASGTIPDLGWLGLIAWARARRPARRGA